MAYQWWNRATGHLNHISSASAHPASSVVIGASCCILLFTVNMSLCIVELKLCIFQPAANYVRHSAAKNKHTLTRAKSTCFASCMRFLSSAAMRYGLCSCCINPPESQDCFVILVILAIGTPQSTNIEWELLWMVILYFTVFCVQPLVLTSYNIIINFPLKPIVLRKE